MKQGNRMVTSHITALIVYLLTIAILTSLMSLYTTKNYLTEGLENGAIAVILFLSTLIANSISLRLEKDKRFATSFVNLFLMTACLFVIGACIDGAYQNIGIRLVAIVIGLLISYTLGTRRNNKRVVRKKRSR